MSGRKRFTMCLMITVVASVFALPSVATRGQGATPTAAESPLAACEETVVEAETVSFANPESSVFAAQGALIGSGPTGVVLSNESGNDPCSWLGLAEALADRGFSVLVYRYSGWSPESDIVGAVQFMRERGFERVLLAGASVGATSSLLAGTTIEPAVDGIAAISPAESAAVEEAAGRLEMPVLLVSTADDPIGASRQASERLFDLLPGERQVLILLGDGHRYALLEGEMAPRVPSLLLHFLESHASPAA